MIGAMVVGMMMYAAPSEAENRPILVPTDNAQTFNLTSVADGVAFDWDCDGVLEQTAWTEANTEVAFLAVLNASGHITCGKDLIGNFTVPGARNGFDALAVLAGGDLTGTKKPSHMDEDNPFFKKLVLWTDRNHNGVDDPGEVVLFGKNYSEVLLGYTDSNRKDGNGNTFRFRGDVLRKDAKKKPNDFGPVEYKAHMLHVYDVFFDSQK